MRILVRSEGARYAAILIPMRGNERYSYQLFDLLILVILIPMRGNEGQKIPQKFRNARILIPMRGNELINPLFFKKILKDTNPHEG